MPDTTRTGPLVKKLSDGIREDLEEAVAYFQRGLDLMRALEGETKGVNGLSSILKAKGDAVAMVITGLEEEAAGVEKKLLGTSRANKQRVDAEKVADVRAAIKEAAKEAGWEEPAEEGGPE